LSSNKLAEFPGRRLKFALKEALSSVMGTPSSLWQKPETAEIQRPSKMPRRYDSINCKTRPLKFSGLGTLPLAASGTTQLIRPIIGISLQMPHYRRFRSGRSNGRRVFAA